MPWHTYFFIFKCDVYSQKKQCKINLPLWMMCRNNSIPCFLSRWSEPLWPKSLRWSPLHSWGRRRSVPGWVTNRQVLSVFSGSMTSDVKLLLFSLVFVTLLMFGHCACHMVTSPFTVCQSSVDLCGFLFPAFPAALLCCLSSVAHLVVFRVTLAFVSLFVWQMKY